MRYRRVIGNNQSTRDEGADHFGSVVDEELKGHDRSARMPSRSPFSRRLIISLRALRCMLYAVYCGCIICQVLPG